MTYHYRQDSYLESKALTAPPHRLHLMLIEGGIRFGRQAADALRNGDEAAAAAPLMRVVDIAGELLAGVRWQQTELNTRLAKLYLYLFHTASVAKVNSDPAKLADVLYLLEFERETWQTFCEKLAAESQPAKATPKADATPRSNDLRRPLEFPISDAAPGLSLHA